MYDGSVNTTCRRCALTYTTDLCQRMADFQLEKAEPFPLHLVDRVLRRTAHRVPGVPETHRYLPHQVRILWQVETRFSVIFVSVLVISSTKLYTLMSYSSAPVCTASRHIAISSQVDSS